MPTTLADLIAPASEERFFAETFGRVPLLCRHGAELVAGLPGRSAFLDALYQGSAAMASRHVILARDGAYLPAGSYTSAEDRLDWPRLRALLEDGCSLVLLRADRMFPGIAGLGEAVASAFHGAAFCNVYLSQPDRRALPIHCDDTDVFVVHVEGTKLWRVYGGQIDSPDEGLSGEGVQRQAGAVAMDPALVPGDVLYLPRGRIHEAVATEGPSLHVSIGVRVPSGLSFVRVLSELARHDIRLRRSLHPIEDFRDGAISPEAVSRIADRLHELIDKNREPIRRHMRK